MLKTHFTIIINLLLIIQVFSQNQNIHIANVYYQQGELEKAKLLYDELAKEPENISSINSNYIQVLKRIGEFKEAKNYFKNILKWFPTNLSYQVDELAYFFDTGQLLLFEKKFENVKTKYFNRRFQLAHLGRQLSNRGMYHEAVEIFLIARTASKVSSDYALELARIYSFLNEKEHMVNEYLNYATLSRQNAGYVKNIFQNLMQDEEDLTFLEQALIVKIQKEPEETIYPDLLIWLELQRKNFFAAFVQSRALDRREQTSGNNTLRVGQIAIENKHWDDAIEIFQYLVNNYSSQKYQAYYRRLLIEAKEGKVKSTFPVDRIEIKNLSKDYKKLFDDIGPDRSTYEGLRNMARLHAFYLQEIDTAAVVLRFLISNYRVGKTLISKCKMDLGDIYILKNQPWEATLLYAQVEKANRDSPIAYEAKLRNARLQYFTGNFALAKSHLDILKRATTRKVSNDAIDMTILITNNTYLDSIDVVMQTYASVDLMIFQNLNKKAQFTLERMLEDYPGHSISDEVYWKLAVLHEQFGEFEKSIEYLTKIIEEFSFDILVDDAAFKIAKLTEESLGDRFRAQELFRKFIVEYPGSSYSAEARTRFRKLRGDFKF